MGKTTTKKNKKSPRPGARLVVFLAVLTLILGTLGVYTVLTVSDLREQVRAVSQLESEVSGLQADLSDTKEQLKKAESDRSKVQKELDKKKKELEEKNKEIKKKDSTIKSLRTQISLKKGGTTKKGATTYRQNLPPFVNHGDYAGKKIVALTFDDGPGPYTARLLNELKKRGVRATFFVLGNRVNSYANLIRRMEAEGHVVGNHSNTHANLTRLSANGVYNEMNGCATKIERILGHKPAVMRCPGGNCNANVKAYAKKAGIPILYWGVDTRDWESRNVNSILKVAFGKNGIKNGSIVLMHDIYPTTVDATIKMVDRLLADGYVLVTVPELLNAREGSIVPGQVYR